MGYIKTIRSYRRESRLRGGGFKTVVCQEREYAEDDIRGQYQLWIDGEYAMNITRQVMQRIKDHESMAFLDDKPPYRGAIIDDLLDQLHQLS